VKRDWDVNGLLDDAAAGSCHDARKSLGRADAEVARMRKALAARCGASRTGSLRGTGSVMGPKKKAGAKKKKKRNLAGARTAPLPAGKEHAADQTGRSHCVYGPDNSLVRCFSKMKTAEQVARGFGSGFHVKHPKGRG
jgi:hypothetical protein